MEIFNKKQIKGLFKILEYQFGIKKILDYVFIKKNHEIYITNRDISKLNLNNLNISRIGILFAEIYNNELILSIEGTQLLKNQINKNIIEINDKEKQLYFHGLSIETTKPDSIYILKNKSDFLGCVKVRNKKILNNLEKFRKIKSGLFFMPDN